MKLGYFLSREEYSPDELVEQAKLAADAGFAGLWISDHFHPWLDAQGESPFVWSMIGAISQVCDLPIMTAVTCPTTRIHPAIVAQAAATSSVLTNGRLVRGVSRGRVGGT
jgi:G6PDH family F420-dependent oxidoreductase